MQNLEYRVYEHRVISYYRYYQSYNLHSVITDKTHVITIRFMHIAFHIFIIENTGLRLAQGLIHSMASVNVSYFFEGLIKVTCLYYKLKREPRT